MSYLKIVLTALFLLTIYAGAAGAQVYVFPFTLSGTEACGSFDVVKVKEPGYVKVELTSNSATLLISHDLSFSDALELDFFAIYPTGTTKAVFSAYGEGTYEGVYTFGIVTGSVKVSSVGDLAGFSGDYIQLDDHGCFYNGTIKSGKRIS